MSSINPKQTISDTVMPRYESSEVFFDTISQKIESKTHADTRLSLQVMLREMRYQMERTAIVLGTKGEQEAFLIRLESMLTNPGEYTQTQIRENLHAIITEEFARGITRARALNLSLGIDLVRPADIEFNFPMVDANTTLVPMDLHLIFDPTHSVADVLSRLFQQYRGRFNAIILLNSNKSPRGVITLKTLQSFAPETTLTNIPVDIKGDFGTVYTPKATLEERMNELGVNIYPIVDSEMNTVIGIMTHENITITDTRYYTATLQAQIGELQLKNEITARV